MGKRELVALLNLSFWCLVMVEGLFLAVQPVCLRFVIVVFPDHTHLLFITICMHIICAKLFVFTKYIAHVKCLQTKFVYMQQPLICRR